MIRNEKRENVHSAKPPAPAGKTKSELIITDPQGSYTGRPKERYEIPVQDADDL